MPLAEFIEESMRLLAGDDVEVAVGPAKLLRSVAGDDWKAVYARMKP
jgi:hypothetical protein